MPSRWIIAAGILMSLNALVVAMPVAEAGDNAPVTQYIELPAIKPVKAYATVPIAGCGLKPGPTRHVTEILDAKTVQLDDGSELRLIGIQTPQRRDAGLAATISKGPYQAAYTFLKKLILGQAIELQFTRRKRDRHDRVLAQAFLVKGGEKIWVQGEMVRTGLALARSEPGGGNQACAKKLQVLEWEARDNARGHWGNQIFRILAARKPGEIARYEQSFQLVEGRVMRVSVFNNKLYLNFGYDWKTDFTLVIGRRMMRQMQGRLDLLKKLKGKTVRVRGWIEMRKGPLISLTAAHELEILPE